MPNPIEPAEMPYSITIYPNTSNGIGISPIGTWAIEGVNYIRIQPGGNCASCEIALHPSAFGALMIKRPLIQVNLEGTPVFYGFVNNAANPDIKNKMSTVQLIGASRRLYEVGLEPVLNQYRYNADGTKRLLGDLAPGDASMDIGAWVTATFDGRNRVRNIIFDDVDPLGWFGYLAVARLNEPGESIGAWMDNLAGYLGGFVVPDQNTDEYQTLVEQYPELDFSAYSTGDIVLGANWGVRADRHLFFERMTNLPLELEESYGSLVGQHLNPNGAVEVEYHEKISLDAPVTQVQWYWGAATYDLHMRKAGAISRDPDDGTISIYRRALIERTDLYPEGWERKLYAPSNVYSYSTSEAAREYGVVYKSIKIEDIYGRANALARYVPAGKPDDPRYGWVAEKFQGGTSAVVVDPDAPPPPDDSPYDPGVITVRGAPPSSDPTMDFGYFAQFHIPLTKDTRAIIIEPTENVAIKMAYFIVEDSQWDKQESQDNNLDRPWIAEEDNRDKYVAVPPIIPINLTPFIDQTTGELKEPTTIYISMDLRPFVDSDGNREMSFYKLGLLEHSPVMDRVARDFYRLPPNTAANIHVDGIVGQAEGYPPVVELTTRGGEVLYLNAEMYEHHIRGDDYMTTTIKIGQPDDDMVIKDLIRNLGERTGRHAV